MIYHVCKKTEWEAALAAGRYIGSSQDQADGFIHFSGPDQVEASVAKHRAGQDGLVLIACDEDKMAPGLKWEVSRGGALFPHQYGELPLDSMVKVSDLPLGEDGKHVFPTLYRPKTIDAFAGPASLWQRFLAFFVDGLVIGVPFGLVGYAFFPEAVRLGDAGRLIGLVVIALYFGYFDSSLGVGQSLGKRLLKIEVTPLSPAKAVLRAWVLYLPFLLNGLAWGEDSRPISTILSVGIFGLILSLLYLFLANRQTRQSLHDLATGALVMRAGALPDQDKRIWKGHFAAVGLFLVLSASLPWLSSYATSRAPAGFSDMVAMKKSAEAVPGVRRVTVSLINTTLKETSGEAPAQSGSSIIVTVIADRVPGDQAGLARSVQDVIFPGHEDFVAEKPVLIVVKYGFDFGIARGDRSFDAHTSLALWQAGR